MSTRILQLQKRASYTYRNIQDKAAYNNSNHVFALSDGTTQSFNSEKWAAIITESFVASPTFEPEKLIGLLAVCASNFVNEKFTFSPNPAIAVLEKAKMTKGSTATFLGLQFLKDNKVNVISCGDTNLFILDDKGKLKECFPYKTIEGLNANNNFINTVQLVDQEIDASFFQTKQFERLKNATYIIATDALSKLFLKNARTVNEVLKIKNFSMLHDFCIKYWDKNELEEDDISAVIIKQDGNEKVDQIIPPAGFEFPKEKECEFNPTPLFKNTELNFTDMQMQDILNQFTGVVNDFREVKRNQKIIQILVIIAIGLALLNFAGLTYLIMSGNKENKEIRENQKRLEQMNNKSKESKSESFDLSIPWELNNKK